MSKETVMVAVSLEDGGTIQCLLCSEASFPVSVLEEQEALAFGEAPVQLCEGGTYEYRLPPDYYLRPIPKVVTTSKTTPGSGRIMPGNYVGTLSLEIIQKGNQKRTGTLVLEVTSVKTDYRTDYRFMLEDIAARCTDLLLQYSSPATQGMSPNPHETAQTIYQRFAFVKAILESSDFTESVYRIRNNPNTQWQQQEEYVRMEKPRRMNSTMLKQLASATRRVDLDENYSLYSSQPSLPAIVSTRGKRETVDTPENRFVKYVLNEFLSFCSRARTKFKPESRAYREALQLESVLENMLSHPMFREISQPSLLALNSPVLQRREGYKEVLHAWLTFNLAARLNWSGGQDVYEAGKRDVATLYEYWVFFVLLHLYCRIFTVDPMSLKSLIGPTKDGLGLLLKKGNRQKITGFYNSAGRNLQIEFSFNRVFNGNQPYPHGGSWTTQMKPDYTLSIWPRSMDQATAEQQESIVHLHFDAKYKLQYRDQAEEEETVYGGLKRDDLLKMHSYRDAIRRSAGAFVLYPGDQPLQQTIFHELLPGVGAFRLHPSRENSGIPELETFIRSAVDHLCDYASQREELAFRVFEIHREKDRMPVKELLPGHDNTVRLTPPSSTKVLIGFCKSDAHRKWITDKQLYNIRVGSKDDLPLTPHLLNIQYILLHGEGELVSGDLRRVAPIPPRVLTKTELKKLGYPKPGHRSYLVFSLADREISITESTWDLRKLPGFSGGRASALPFVVSLSDLAQAKVSHP